MRTLTLLLTLLLTAPLAAAQTTTDVQQYAADFEDVRANHTIRSNGSVPYQIGNVSHYLVGNITNQSLSQNRTWTLPDLTGTVALSDSAGNIQWAAVSKSGSSLADLATRAISDTTGDLPWARVDKTGSSLADLATRAIGDTTGTLATTRGGTGLTSYATGDIIYASAADTLAKLPAGTNGHVLTLTGGVPTWQAGGGSDCTTDCTFTGTVTANRLVATHDTSGASGWFPILQANTSITGGTLSATTGAFSGLLSANAGLTVAATTAFKLPVQSSVTMPSVGQGVCAYDSTNHRVQCGMGSSPSYKTLANLADAQTWTGAQTFGADTIVNGKVGVGNGATNIGGASCQCAFVTLKGTGGTAASILEMANAASSTTTGNNIAQWLFYNGATAVGEIDVKIANGVSNSGDFVVSTANAGTLAEVARFTYDKKFQLADGSNIVVGTTTGTQIGTASTQKIGFLGATPIARKTLTDNTGGNGGTTCNVIGGVTYTTDAPAIRDCQTRILAVLREFGFIN